MDSTDTLPPRRSSSIVLLDDNSDDVLLRIMEYLGPRHATIGLGSTCRRLRRLSRDDTIWISFSGMRCFLPPPIASTVVPPMPSGEKVVDEPRYHHHRGCGGDGDECEDIVEGVGPHGAALAFRHIMSEMGPSSSSLYEAYVRVHTMMKLRNLRVGADVVVVVGGRVGGGRGIRINARSDDDRDEDVVVERSTINLIAPACSQTWPGRLSDDRRGIANDDDIHAMDDDDDGDDGDDNVNARVGARYVIACHNPAEAWCDDPRCNVARCGGSRGCLRRYRFSPSPPPPNSIVGGEFLHSITGWRSDGEYESSPPSSFVKCSWCGVSFCNEHGGGGDGSDDYFERRRSRRGGGDGNDGGGSVGICGMRSWYECDECNLSSCPDCMSQVFPSCPPNAGKCRIVTAGRACRRSVCASCVWHVGRKGQRPNDDGTTSTMTENVPGGDYARLRRESSSYDVVTIRGIDAHIGGEWEEHETCCSRCLRHVEFRWRELARVQESFRGFMP
ncbi:hypothetical protein ACHAXA_002136 [Cyclostephanos tholiformis]|uniref:Uncharacterized protein n=1 Tax=Cyclostephanos tholiformis TaxID=382380 RepID=A0ABD3RQX8_9STRA